VPTQSFGDFVASQPRQSFGDFIAATAQKPEQPSNLQRFAQSWWDHSVLKHPIDSAVGLVKSLVTFPDYHALSQDEKDQVDAHVEKAFHEAAHPTPELAGQVASSGTNAALITGATMGLAKGLGAVIDNADVIKGAARGAKNALTETAHFKGFDIPGGNVMAGSAGGSMAAHALGLPGELGAALGGAAPIVKGAVAGGRAALAARVAKAAAEGKVLSPDIVASILEELNAEPVPVAEAAAEAPASAEAPIATAQWEPGPAGTPEPWAPYQSPATGPVAQPAPPAAAAPGLTELQRMEDAADQHAAYLQGQADTITWANRTRKADRFSKYLQKNNLEPTAENLKAATKALAEREVPSAETVDMIHDRLGYQAAAPDLERQLADSIAAAKAKGATAK
jgi:hypothetical protein